MPRETRKQQVHAAVEGIVMRTCALHSHARQLLADTPPTHGSSEAHAALEETVDKLSVHIEDIASLAAVIDLSMTRLVIAHFKAMAEHAALSVPRPGIFAGADAPSPDTEVPDFVLQDGEDELVETEVHIPEVSHE